MPFGKGKGKKPKLCGTIVLWGGTRFAKRFAGIANVYLVVRTLVMTNVVLSRLD